MKNKRKNNVKVEKKTFYCVKCQKKHLVDSKKGKLHWVFDISKITDKSGCRADVFLMLNGEKVSRRDECRNLVVGLTIQHDKVMYPICKVCWDSRVCDSDKW